MHLHALTRTVFASCALVAAAGADAAELTFRVPFDGSPVAAVAKGNAKPQIARGLEYAPGVDSLLGIKEFVYEKKAVSLQELG